MRAVVDTNVWISAVLNPTGPPAVVRAALQRKQFVLVTSEPLLTELALVLARRGIAVLTVRRFLTALETEETGRERS